MTTMNHSRRRFLHRAVMLAGLLLTHGVSLARDILKPTTRNKPAFTSEDLANAISQYLNGTELIDTDQIDIGVHDMVENGAVVPIKVNTSLTGADDIAIFVEHNPNPLIAQFKLGPRSQPFIATRIKVHQPSNITIIVKANGKAYQHSKFVEVVEGGCG